jgi:catechol O-methyltransferase
VVELGGYVGYSAIRIARLLQPGSQMFTIELNPEFAATAREMIKFAGLEDVCKIFVGESSEVLKTLQDKISSQHVDLFFIDHWKTLYLRDLKIIESMGMLKKGSVLVADNVIFPGAPDYLKYVRSSSSYKSKFNEAKVEYSEVADGVEVTIVQ